MNSFYEKAMRWIENNTIDGHGITVTNKERVIYPEVTGYYIPTLLNWNMEELAVKYAKYLCSIQKANGSWYDPHDIEPYLFDSCQILKGLVAVCEYYHNGISQDGFDFKPYLKKGCDWVISNIDSSGRMAPCRKDTFETYTGYSELIHIYCLSPLVDASRVLGLEGYEKKAKLCLNYYIENNLEQILDFHLLAHFYAYVMEGLVDMGRLDVAKEAMDKIALIQDENGFIPAYKDVNWTCSTALFQFAITWYKMGEIEKANKTYEYGCTLQNASGGWFGKYPISNGDQIREKILYKSHIKPLIKKHRPLYFSDQEISWADKFFLDALWLKNKAE